MSFRFRRTFSLLPGLRLNVGAAGPSVSVGTHGANLTFGAKGMRVTAGLPGTGVFYSKQVSAQPVKETEQMALPASVEQVVRERPPHWELLLVQAALRSALDEINRAAAAASAHGTEASAFVRWIAEIPEEFSKLITELDDLLNNEMPAAFVSAGQAGDAEPLVAATDHLISLTRTALDWEQGTAALARHQLYGDLAKPLRGMAQPFVDLYNRLTDFVDEALSKNEVEHHLNFHVDLNLPPSFVESFRLANDDFISRFFDSNYIQKSGDVVMERFEIARAEERLGSFSRAAIADNLRNNLFRADDWFWSDDTQSWQPLGSLSL